MLGQQQSRYQRQSRVSAAPRGPNSDVPAFSAAADAGGRQDVSQAVPISFAPLPSSTALKLPDISRKPGAALTPPPRLGGSPAEVGWGDADEPRPQHAGPGVLSDVGSELSSTFVSRDETDDGGRCWTDVRRAMAATVQRGEALRRRPRSLALQGHEQRQAMRRAAEQRNTNVGATGSSAVDSEALLRRARRPVRAGTDRGRVLLRADRELGLSNSLDTRRAGGRLVPLEPLVSTLLSATRSRTCGEVRASVAAAHTLLFDLGYGADAVGTKSSPQDSRGRSPVEAGDVPDPHRAVDPSAPSHGSEAAVVGDEGATGDDASPKAGPSSFARTSVAFADVVTAAEASRDDLHTDESGARVARSTSMSTRSGNFDVSDDDMEGESVALQRDANFIERFFDAVPPIHANLTLISEDALLAQERRRNRVPQLRRGHAIVEARIHLRQLTGVEVAKAAGGPPGLAGERSGKHGVFPRLVADEDLRLGLRPADSKKNASSPDPRQRRRSSLSLRSAEAAHIGATWALLSMHAPPAAHRTSGVSIAVFCDLPSSVALGRGILETNVRAIRTLADYCGHSIRLVNSVDELIGTPADLTYIASVATSAEDGPGGIELGSSEQSKARVRLLRISQRLRGLVVADLVVSRGEGHDMVHGACGARADHLVALRHAGQSLSLDATSAGRQCGLGGYYLLQVMQGGTVHGPASAFTVFLEEKLTQRHLPDTHVLVEVPDSALAASTPVFPDASLLFTRLPEAKEASRARRMAPVAAAITIAPIVTAVSAPYSLITRVTQRLIKHVFDDTAKRWSSLNAALRLQLDSIQLSGDVTIEGVTATEDLQHFRETVEHFITECLAAEGAPPETSERVISGWKRATIDEARPDLAMGVMVLRCGPTPRTFHKLSRPEPVKTITSSRPSPTGTPRTAGGGAAADNQTSAESDNPVLASSALVPMGPRLADPTTGDAGKEQERKRRPSRQPLEFVLPQPGEATALSPNQELDAVTSVSFNTAAGMPAVLPEQSVVVVNPRRASGDQVRDDLSLSDEDSGESQTESDAERPFTVYEPGRGHFDDSWLNVLARWTDPATGHLIAPSTGFASATQWVVRAHHTVQFAGPAHSLGRLAKAQRFGALDIASCGFCRVVDIGAVRPLALDDDTAVHHEAAVAIQSWWRSLLAQTYVAPRLELAGKLVRKYTRLVDAASQGCRNFIRRIISDYHVCGVKAFATTEARVRRELCAEERSARVALLDERVFRWMLLEARSRALLEEERLSTTTALESQFYAEIMFAQQRRVAEGMCEAFTLSVTEHRQRQRAVAAEYGARAALRDQYAASAVEAKDRMARRALARERVKQERLLQRQSEESALLRTGTHHTPSRKTLAASQSTPTVALPPPSDSDSDISDVSSDDSSSL